MFICLFIALLLSFWWINILFAESISAKLNPYQRSEADRKKDENNAKLKIAISAMMAIFWATVIYFW